MLYKRLFHDGDNGWMLLGGNALIIRTAGGRFTQDIDLARTASWDSLDSLRDELSHLITQPVENDQFTFELLSLQPRSEPDSFGYGARTAKAKIAMRLGADVFETISLDLTTGRHVDGPVDLVPPVPVIDDPTLADLPRIPVVPIENHLADKVCAMYELHGETGTPSTRYRDLADVVRIIARLELDAGRLGTLLNHEAARRQTELPTTLRLPSPEWARRYGTNADDVVGIDDDLRDLESSLVFAGGCLNEILDGTRSTGRWNPIQHAWQD
ncbi:hypothetical protein AXF14_04210 [Actinomyces radicidentis]|uniref:Nucleotidyl transferase AbiEii/AbiGii toxin family protein n=1 Tax=Actinomyces radicidentis TaxID=111015 RepID=A0A120KMF4_ACTRD|nr:hypothetical protein AXF14_04210 [Actinomyces radicidentis]